MTDAHDSPRFSLVVPTRRASQTLPHTLATCLDQDYEDYEIVVSDNDADRDTRALVAEHRSPRLRYLQTGAPLAMSDSWEFAVSHARGEYVIVVGSDDALLPGALRHLHEALKLVPAPAVRWEQSIYLWPNVAMPALQNRLSVPLGRFAHSIGCREVVEGTVNGRLHFAMLPSVYWGAVRRDTLDSIRAKAGRVFAGSSPDIYSGFAVACAVPQYLSLDYPLAVLGLSSTSNGISTLHSGGPIAREFRELNRRSGFACHAMVPDLPVASAAVADMFLQATANLGMRGRARQLDRKALCRRCLGELLERSATEWQPGLEAIRLSLGDSRRLSAWFARECQDGPARRDQSVAPMPEPGLHGTRLVLDANAFGVSNVREAALLSAALLGPLPNFREAYVRPLMGAMRRVQAAARILLRGY